MDGGWLCAWLGLFLFAGVALPLGFSMVYARLRSLSARVEGVEASLRAALQEERAARLALAARLEALEAGRGVDLDVAPVEPVVAEPASKPVAVEAPVEAPLVAPGAAPVVAPVAPPAAAPVRDVPAPIAARPVPPARPVLPARGIPGVETLAVWFAASLGTLILVVAVLFGLREVIAVGLFGPSLRFAAAVLAALAAWSFSGLARARKFEVPANALAGGGTAIAYGALWAGYALYGLYGQEFATGSMVAVTAVSMYAAVRKDAGLWALLAAAGGYATPLLLATGENKAVAFFAYLALLNAGVLVASRRRGWWWLIVLAGTVTAALHLGWGVQFRAPDQVAVALGASLVLSLGFLYTARAGASAAVRAAAFYGALVLLLVGVPFLVPADPLVLDPVSSEPLRWTMGWTAEIGACWLGGVAALLVAVGGKGTAAADRAVRVLISALLALALVSLGLGWIFAAEPRLDVVVGAAIAVLGLTGIGARLRGPELGMGPLLVGALLLGVGNGVAAPEPGWMLALSLAVTGAGLALALVLDVAAPFAALAAMLPLLVNLHTRVTPFAPEGGYALLAMVVAYEAFAVVLALRLRPTRVGTALAVIIAGPAAFYGFHVLWLQGIGRGEGALAVLLGIHLAFAARLARVRGVQSQSGLFAGLLIAMLCFAALAIPLQLERSYLTVGWALEVALLAALSRRYTHASIRWFLGVLAVAVSVRLLLNPSALQYGRGEGMYILNWTLYTWGVPGAALLVAGALLPGPAWGKQALRVSGTLIGFALVNLEVAHAFAHDGALSFTSENLVESMTRSISWGLYGLVVMGVGLWRDSRPARLFGFGFALLAAGKVCLVDVIALPGWIRIGSLFGLAIVLLVASVVFMRVVLRDRRRSEEQR